MTKSLVYDQRPPRPVAIVGNALPSFPDDFNRRLQRLDQDLWITWHLPPHVRHKAGRWKIELCTAHHSGEFWPDGRPKHTHVCGRAYVLMVQDDEGTPAPLGDWVLEKLRERRAYSESFGGETERGRVNFVAASNRIDAELASKREEATADMNRHNRRYNRVQFNKLMQLIERHDMRPNK